MADAFAHVIIYRLPIEYPKKLANWLRRLSPDDVTETCRQILAAGSLRWMVVGEAAELFGQLTVTIPGGIQVVDSNSPGLP